MRTANRSHAQATERDIRKILNLPTTTWRKFWQECKTQGYITGNDQDGYQLIDIFRYGRLDRRRTTKIQKLYVEAFIRLYRHGRIIGPNTNRALKNSDHRLIGALIYLAAYHMCPATNEIVANPDEPVQYKLTPLDEMGIAAALGYRVEAGHAMREVNKLRDLTFRLTDNGPDLYCLARVEAGRRRNNVRYIINPALIYAGDRANYNPIMQGLHWFVDDKNKKQDSA